MELISLAHYAATMLEALPLLTYRTIISAGDSLNETIHGASLVPSVSDAFDKSLGNLSDTLDAASGNMSMLSTQTAALGESVACAGTGPTVSALVEPCDSLLGTATATMSTHQEAMTQVTNVRGIVIANKDSIPSDILSQMSDAISSMQANGRKAQVAIEGLIQNVSALKAMLVSMEG